MRNKGFTLIELLAVIVVLAIIALIATPMVLNTIEEARQGAAQSSAYSYVSEVETKLATYMLKNNGNSYTPGKQSIAALKTALGIELKGDTPSDGYVCIGTDGTVTKASIKINDHVVSYDGKEATTTEAEEVENITCDGSGEVVVTTPTILEKTKTLVYAEDGQTCKTDGSTYNYMNGCYIKGASENNYIWYNGFMWRIMGINSDGTVRMITDENVTTLAYGAENTGLTYTTNKGYIHDWLTNYFFSHLNSSKDEVIQEGAYFCNESTNTTCASENIVTTKIGLISKDEYSLAGGNDSYLKIPQRYWTMTPYSESEAWRISKSLNAIGHDAVTSTLGVRPVINVGSSKSIITAGDGTAQNFYVLYEDKSTNITGTLNEKVTSGEYVNLEGKIYRVVRKTDDGVKLILDGYYEETDSYNTSSDNKFVLTSGIGAKLNGEILEWLGLHDSNKIVATIFYQGDYIDDGASYENTLNKTNGVTAKVGLIQLGDILAGQSSTIFTENYTVRNKITQDYWTMNKYTNATHVWCVSDGTISTSQSTSAKAVRPVITVRNDLNIMGGNGTWKSPYQI